MPGPCGRFRRAVAEAAPSVGPSMPVRGALRRADAGRRVSQGSQTSGKDFRAMGVRAVERYGMRYGMQARTQGVLRVLVQYSVQSEQIGCGVGV